MSQQRYEHVIQADMDWQNAFDSIPDLVCILDTDARIRWMNRAFIARLNKSNDELIGSYCQDVICGSRGQLLMDTFRIVMETGRTIQIDQDVELQDSLFNASLSPYADSGGKVRGAVHIFRDITEQRKHKDKIMQSDKMAAIVTLAAEIAHEINNPLHYINNYLYLLSESMPPDVTSKEYLVKIQTGIDKLAALTRNLLEFSRPRMDAFITLDVQRIMDSSLELAAQEIAGKRIKIIKAYGCSDTRVRGSESMIQQVFLNLIQNAVDAMASGGSITVTTSRSADRFVLEFEDTGRGIRGDNVRKIFEPFFTTKKRSPKKGTGLGLTICYNIIKHHLGEISVFSVEDKGTTFTISLPAVSQ